MPFRIYSSRRERQPKATTVTLSNSLLTFFLSSNYLQPSSVGEKKLIHARGKSLHFPPAKLKQKEGCVLSGGDQFVLCWFVQIQEEKVCACSYTQPLADPSEPRNQNTRVSEHLLLSARTQPPRTIFPALLSSDVGFNKPCRRGAVSSPSLTSPAGGKIPAWDHCWLSDSVPAP